MAEKQISKLGGTIYNFNGLSFEPNKTLTLSASALNEMRRQLISNINADRVHRNEPILKVNNNFKLQLPNRLQTSKNLDIRLRVRNFNQLSNINLQDINYIILPLDSIISQKDIPSNIISKIIVQPPRFIQNEFETIEKLSQIFSIGIRHLMCNNLAYINIGNRLGYKLHGDFGLNMVNSLAIDTLKRLNCMDTIVSFELKLSQIDALNKSIPIGLEAYGRLPLMLVRNCPIKNEVGCKECHHSISDRTNRTFPVYCTDGYSEIFNAEVMSIADRLDSINNIDYYVLSFVNETSNEVANVIKDFKNRCKMGSTKGLYVRGII